jgi:4-carboxymuconolactone decarboxylase
MYLPKKYLDFAANYSEIFETYKDLGTKIRESGPLDKKTQNLVKLGIAAGANSRGAVMSHTRKALDSGATNEEINHAILLAMSTTGFPNMIASFHWAGEVLEKKGE